MGHTNNTSFVAARVGGACLSSIVLALPLVLAPAKAEACGGTFCDNGPTPMPVDQTGEDILFIRDGNEIEVHVRIQYTGEAERFAWMVPLQAVPEVSLGSEPLFRQLSASTIPVWSTSRTFMDPDDQPAPSTTLGFVPDDDPGGGGGPVVVHHELVGDFEVVVLQGGTASEVIEFFIANDYAFEDDAEPLIQEYIDEGFLITGIKLTAGAAVEAIQPLVFRFAGSEPCVPIRLTSVAARDDMGIRAYFLGEERWAPSNYKHVLVNPMAFDWVNLDFTTYVETLSRAVDEAGGQAFVTEYAGPSEVISTWSIWREEWTSEGMAAMTEHELITTLDVFGLMPSTGLRAELYALMREFLPPPGNWPSDEVTFWYWFLSHPGTGGLIDGGWGPGGSVGPLDPLEWDMAGFAAGFEERIVAPGAHAVEILEAWPMLTRLHTTMSAHEMTLDPTFHPVPELDEVLEQRQSQSVVYPGFTYTAYTVPMEISGPTAEVESTADLCVANDGNWPWDSPTIADMPRALRVEEIPVSGAPQVVLDNEAAILEAVQWHNLETPCSTGEPAGGESGESGGSGGSEGAGAQDGGASCACSSDPRGGGGGGALAFGLGLLGLAGFARARRRS
jgi:MYXO-CTERM domain-containing protein